MFPLFLAAADVSVKQTSNTDQFNVPTEVQFMPIFLKFLGGLRFFFLIGKQQTEVPSKHGGSSLVRDSNQKRSGKVGFHAQKHHLPAVSENRTMNETSRGIPNLLENWGVKRKVLLPRGPSLQCSKFETLQMSGSSETGEKKFGSPCAAVY